MRKQTITLAIAAFLSITTAVCCAQTGIISTVAGNGPSGGFSGDGGPATLAAMYPYSTAFDKAGNMYIADQSNNRIRKVTPAGIISTFAGTGTQGFTGDGGPAASAEFWGPSFVIFDDTGNLCIADYGNNCVRKINTSGIISTVAGVGGSGGSYGGDGGPATAAHLYYPNSIAIDGSGNLLIGDFYNSRIRKINASGIISTVAGTTEGYSGDGGPATSAQINLASGVTVDNAGNLYIADYENDRIRKVNTSGIISNYGGNGYGAYLSGGYAGDGNLADSAELYYPNCVIFDQIGNLLIADTWNNAIRKINHSGVITTIVGNGTAGYTGDGGPASAATIHGPENISLDVFGDLFIADYLNGVVRKVTRTPDEVAGTFSVYINGQCGGVNLVISTASYAATYTIRSWFGDGTSISTPVTSGYGGGYASVSHSYNNSGTYTVKNVLYNGTTPLDSVSYSYTSLICGSLPVSFYHDVLGTCAHDSVADNLLRLPVLVEIDSNSVPVDTISATSGMYYGAAGLSGDIYTFKIISSPGYYASCPAPSGMAYDTLIPGADYAAKYIGFHCDVTSSYDLAVYATMRCGRHMATTDLYVFNNYCTPENAVFTYNISPKYIFSGANPAPSSVSGNTVTWNFPFITSNDTPKHIQLSLTIPTSSWLAPGDTVQSYMVVNPTGGDTDTSNNTIIRVDTIKSSYDPNYIAVSPSGYISSGAQLQYTINFENTGNDTAHNIYVMDTLSDNVDIHSLRVLAASAVMNISSFVAGGHNIVKFDFPAIMLPDSSHHNQCDGTVLFSINAKGALSNGTTIFNHAGIFFDDNPVVLTDTVEDIIGLPSRVSVIRQNKIALYPNPVTENLTITGITGDATYKIYNITGITILQGSLTEGSNTLSMKNCAAGIYILETNGTGGQRNISRVVKE